MKFDRKTFNPLSSDEERRALAQLRAIGGARWWRQGWEKWARQKSSHKTLSSAFGLIPFSPSEFKGKVLIDAGCGHSGDADHFTNNGGVGIGYDLFPRTLEVCNILGYTHKRSSSFQIQDICEPWPNEDKSVDIIVCSAVLDLLTSEERKMFYTECKRVIKKDGVVALSFMSLKWGHGFSLTDEASELKKIGFEVHRILNDLLVLPV